jgi:uncharacterized protein YciI
MRWVAIFDDTPGADAVRTRHADEHFEYLGRHRDKIVIGGGLRSQPGARYCGGLWVLDVEGQDEAVALCEGDPYFVHGLRAGYRLYVWGKAPVYGLVSL